MRTNYNDSSNRGGRYPKRTNGGSGGGGSNGGGGGRRPQQGRRSPGQHSNGGVVNISSVSATRNKYLDLAKEALSNGNRVEAENYYQHAEHYSKMLSAAMLNKKEREESAGGSHNHQRRHNNQGNSESNEQRAPQEEKTDKAEISDSNVAQDNQATNQPLIQ